MPKAPLYRANAGAPVLVLIRLQSRSGSPGSVDEFLAVLAHELRNPLAPIRNSMQLMQASEGDVGTMSAARAIVERQIKHLSRIIEDLLDISRITQGKIELHRQAIDLTDIIHLALEIARPQLEGNSIRCRSSWPATARRCSRTQAVWPRHLRIS